MTWKGLKVVLFKHKMYKGYYPTKTYTVIEETEGEVLIKRGFRKKWVFKWNKDLRSMVDTPRIGYCKLIK